MTLKEMIKEYTMAIETIKLAIESKSKYEAKIVEKLKELELGVLVEDKIYEVVKDGISIRSINDKPQQNNSDKQQNNIEKQQHTNIKQQNNNEKIELNGNPFQDDIEDDSGDFNIDDDVKKLQDNENAVAAMINSTPDPLLTKNSYEALKNMMK